MLTWLKCLLIWTVYMSLHIVKMQYCTIYILIHINKVTQIYDLIMVHLLMKRLSRLNSREPNSL